MSVKNRSTTTEKGPLTEYEEQAITKYLAYLRSKGISIDDKEVYPKCRVGDREIDAVLHSSDCTWYVIEVERGSLTYTGLGQILHYRHIFQRHRRLRPKAVVICESAPEDLKETCIVDQGIEVFELQRITY